MAKRQGKTTTTRTFSTEQAGAALEVHPKTVTAWAREGCPHDARPYRFNIAEVRGWLTANKKTGKPGRPTDEVGGDGLHSGGSLKAAQTAVAGERALMMRAVRLEKEGALHNANECQARRLRQIHATRNKFLGLARSIAPAVMGKPLDEVENIINAEVERILRSFEAGD